MKQGSAADVLEPPTPPVPASDVSRRALRAGVALGLRQVLVQGTNILGGVFIARMLTPAEFGIYGVFTFFLVFLITFGDVGLGASLVRQPEEPSTEDMRSVFTLQQGLVALAVVVTWVAAPVIAEWYHRSPSEAWLFRLAALSLFFTSLQSIASIRLERQLAFDRLAVPEVAQAIVFNGLAVWLAWSGAGAVGVAAALVARSAVGAVLVNLISPWPMGFRWDWPRVREHLRFGVAYQGGSFVSMGKDSITPLLVGTLLGAREVGYINWAQMLSAYPVIALMILQRIYLPAFARMQHDRVALGRFVERVLRTSHSLCAPLAMLSLALAVPITRVVFGDKWLPALPIFYLCWTATLTISSSGPLGALLNALGEAWISFRFTVLWALVNWGVGIPAVMLLGAVGYGVANVGVQLATIPLLLVVKKRVPLRILPAMLPPWTAASIAAGVVWLVARVRPPTTLPQLVLLGMAGMLGYALCYAVLMPDDARRAWGWVSGRR